MLISGLGGVDPAVPSGLFSIFNFQFSIPVRVYCPRLKYIRMSGKQEPITVEIYGQRYNVRGEGDPAYLTELAQFVDSRMREVASQVSSLDPVKIAILAALNIADELNRTRKQQRDTNESWMERTQELADKLGRSLV